jgi:16S rRNA (uracil1498-N3)-methyltransferase
MTTSFYVPPSGFRGAVVTFPQDEARHAASVLRHRAGDLVRVVDGEGGAFIVRLDRSDRNGVTGQVVERDDADVEPPFEITLAIGMIKNRSRFETMLEKTTELGVRTIIPVISERTERDRVREGRVEAILIAAMKQSHRAVLPQLEPAASLTDVIGRDGFDVRLICHEAPQTRDDGRVEVSPGARILVVIGPEGGFSDREVASASAARFRIWQLGRRRLRAETAAIAALSAINVTCESDTRFEWRSPKANSNHGRNP